MKLISKKPQMMKVKNSPWKKIGKNPYTDWSIILLVSFGVAAALILLGVSVYMSMEEEIEPAQASSAVNIDKALLRKIIGQFEKRDALRREIQSVNYRFSDPSL